MSTADWLTLFVHMMALSLFTIGGAIAAIPDIVVGTMFMLAWNREHDAAVVRALRRDHAAREEERAA